MHTTYINKSVYSDMALVYFAIYSSMKILHGNMVLTPLGAMQSNSKNVALYAQQRITVFFQQYIIAMKISQIHLNKKHADVL
jgi:hypothetical protein